MPGVELLAAGLEGAGFAVAELEAVTSGSFSIAAVAALNGGGRVFAKTQTDADADLFEVEAAGLSALHDLGGSGQPALIDPAVSCTWPEIDLAMLWVQRRPAGADRFFAVYEELAARSPAGRTRRSYCGSGTCSA